MGRYFAPYALSTPGRIVFGVIYLAWTALSIYGATQIEIYFDIKFFVSKESTVYEWYEANEKYFSTGGIATTTYIEDDVIDFSTTEMQAKVLAFNEAF